MRLLRCLSLFLTLLALTSTALGEAVVSGFLETTNVLPGVTGITDLEWAPDETQRLFISQQNGIVRIVKGGMLLPSPFLTISPVRSGGESGLLCICFDPNFSSNKFVYVFVTVSFSEQQIQRYTAVADAATNKVVIVGGLNTGGYHNGGAIAVGHDGKLYWGIGDTEFPSNADGNLTSFASKISRANLDGSVPHLNPFIDGPGPLNDYIWARGLRNPFKCAFQPKTGLLWVNVVGSAFEQAFVIDRAQHAGWYRYESSQLSPYIQPKIKYPTRGSGQFAVLTAVRTNNVITITPGGALFQGHKVTLNGVADASFDGSYYVHSASESNFTVLQVGPDASSSSGIVTPLLIGTGFSAAITGGCFYNGTAFPVGYHGNYFFCDYIAGRICRATLDESNQVTSVDYLVGKVAGAVDIVCGPDGALYYAGHPTNRLYRLAYTNGPQRLIVSPVYLNMAEGGMSAVNISLRQEPTTPVTVTISPGTASSGIWADKTELVFTPANYSVPQPILVRALADGDGLASHGTIVISSLPLSEEQVHVNAYDPEGGKLKFTALLHFENETTLKLATERSVGLYLEASPDLKTWFRFSTNYSTTDSLTIVPPLSAPQTNTFYRALTIPF